MSKSLGTMSVNRERIGCRARNGRPPTRVLVVEDHRLIAIGLQLALSGRRWHVGVISETSPAAIIGQVRRVRPHCVVMCVHLNGSHDAISIIDQVAAIGPQVLLITDERRRTILASFLEAGAAGWIASDLALDEVHAILARLADGRPIVGKTVRATLLDELRRERERVTRTNEPFADLTEREAHVLAAMADGLTADEIAREHCVALCTIRSQIRSVLQKLDVHSQLAAAAMAAPRRELLPHRGQVLVERRRPPHAPGVFEHGLVAAEAR